MTLSITIDRSSLSLADLSLTDTPGGAFWLPEDALQRPAKAWRRTYAGSSPWLHGSTLTAAVLEQSTLPFTIYTQAASAAALDMQMDELEAALSQFTYDTTVTVNGVAKTWACDPGDIGWGEVDSGMARVHMARASVSIPVYPIAS